MTNVQTVLMKLYYLLCVQIKESRKRPKNNEACICEYTLVMTYVIYYTLVMACHILHLSDGICHILQTVIMKL